MRDSDELRPHGMMTLAVAKHVRLTAASTMLSVMFVAGSLHAAENEEARLVRPRGSNLALIEETREPGLSARFRGAISVRGRFVAHWPDGAPNRAHPQPSYELIPDAKSRASLPHYELRTRDGVLRYAPERVVIEADETMLRRAVGESEARRLLERRVDRVESSGRYLIEDYRVGIECDAPWASAALLRVERDEPLAHGTSTIEETC